MDDVKALDQTADNPALDVDTILTIHRDPRGHIGFVRKPAPGQQRLDKYGKPRTFETLFSIPAGELRAFLPGFAEWLASDSYFTVNAYYSAAPWQNTTTGLPDVRRRERDLSRLTACYCDVDCGRPESCEPGAALEWRQAQHEVETLADAGTIPQPSIMARSGRGVYVLWLLRDEYDATTPPKAWPEKLQLYKLCNRSLNALLRTHALPADRQAIDAARVLRVPGSVHSKSGRRVQYVVQLDQAGRGFVYTLSELATILQLAAPAAELPPATRTLAARPPQYRKVRTPGSVPLRSLGKKQLHALRAQDLLTIETWRGGFKQRGAKYDDGSTSCGRRRILSLYAGLLRGAGENADAALKALQTMAANMRPPYPSGPAADDPPIETIVQNEFASVPRKWKNETLCSLFGITADVARNLELKTIRPRSVAVEADQARPHIADMVNDRREFARQYVERHNGHATARSLARAYLHAGYVGANPQTANNDLNAIGCNVIGRARAGRPRKAFKV